MLNGLIVSCQARQDNPLHGPAHMQVMARAAVEGGATAIRANGPSDISAIRASVNVPVIGIRKVFSAEWEVRITPDAASARLAAEAGAPIVAFDATARPRPAEPLPELISYIRNELGREAFADVSTLEEGLAAEEFGTDYVATTLSGYTRGTRGRAEGPDLGLVAELARHCRRPVVAEGRFRTPDQVRAALDLGAAAVVVGTAITNPRQITRWFAAALEGA